MIKTLDKAFVIELRQKDIETITDALQELYIYKAAAYKTKGGEDRYNKKIEVRDLRNELADLIGIRHKYTDKI